MAVNETRAFPIIGITISAILCRLSDSLTLLKTDSSMLLFVYLLQIELLSTCEKQFFYQSFTVGTYVVYVSVKKIQSDEIEDLSKINTFIAQSVNAPLKYLLVRNN